MNLDPLEVKKALEKFFTKYEYKFISDKRQKFVSRSEMIGEILAVLYKTNEAKK